jgi:hypothetical protein
MYTGMGTGIKVHRLRPVRRDEVILPRTTLALLERNVIRFVRQRPRLAGVGLAAKKGLLFHGPPGTGKTHTLHYLVGELEGVTTLLVTAEQMGAVGGGAGLGRRRLHGGGRHGRPPDCWRSPAPTAALRPMPIHRLSG